MISLRAMNRRIRLGETHRKWKRIHTHARFSSVQNPRRRRTKPVRQAEKVLISVQRSNAFLSGMPNCSLCVPLWRMSLYKRAGSLKTIKFFCSFFWFNNGSGWDQGSSFFRKCETEKLSIYSKVDFRWMFPFKCFIGYLWSGLRRMFYLSVIKKDVC